MKKYQLSSQLLPPHSSHASKQTQTSLSLQVYCIESSGEGRGEREDRNYECWIEVVRNRMIGYDGKRQKVEWEFELDSNVLLSVEEANKVNVENQKQINKIKFIIKGKINSITLYHPQVDLLLQIYPFLIQKPIFLDGFKSHYKPFKILPKSQYTVPYIVKSISDEAQFFVRAYRISLLSEKPKINDKFLNEFYTLKNINFPSIVRLEAAYKSPNTIYLVFQKMDYSLKTLLSSFFPNLIGKKIIVRTVLQTLQYLHKQHVYHRSISIKSLFVEYNNENSKFRVKLGSFDECIKAKEGKKAKVLEKEDIEAVGYLFQLLLNEKFVYDQLSEQFQIKGEKESECQKGADLLKRLISGKMSAEEALKHQYLREVEGEWIQKKLK